MKKKDLKGKIKFYQDELDYTFPKDFSILKTNLCSMLSLTEDFLKNLRIFYFDSDMDKVEIKVEEDYQIFLDEVERSKQPMKLNIEVKEESIIDIKKCSSSIINYKNKMSSGSIEEDIKNNENPLEVSDEIIINQEKKLNSKIEEKEDDKDKLNENKDNIIIKTDNNVKFFPQISNVQNVESNSPSDKNSYQLIPQNEEEQNKKMQNHNYLHMLSFPCTCSICKKSPITQCLYYCKECNMMLCEKCEKLEGPRHIHALNKVQNPKQFDYLNLNKLSKFDQFIDGVGNKIEETYNSMIGMFWKNKDKFPGNEVEFSRKEQVKPSPQWISLVNLARTTYELSNFTDKEIEAALIKSKGNIDEAIPLLFQ